MAVDESSARRIRGSALELRVVRQTGEAALQQSEGSALTSQRQGRCVFLEDDGLCAVHRDLGVEAKPRACRQFPFLLRPGPRGVVVGTSFFCPSIQANRGRPLADYEAELRGLLEETPLPALDPEGVEVHEGRKLGWRELGALERFLLRRLKGGVEEALGVAFFSLCRWSAGGGSRLEALLRQTRLPPDRMRARLAATLVGSVEAASPPESPALTEALVAGRSVSLRRSGWVGPAPELESREPLPSWWQRELRRYLRHLVSGGFLLAPGPLLDRLTVLYLTPLLLAWYCRLSARRRGSTAVEAGDWGWAVSLVERHYVTHATGIEPLVGWISRTYVRQVGFLFLEERRGVELRRRPPLVRVAALLLTLAGAIWLAAARPPEVPLLVHGHARLPEVALTIESGGPPVRLEEVARSLQGARATFLFDERTLRSSASLVRRLVAEGHEIEALPDRPAEPAGLLEWGRRQDRLLFSIAHRHPRFLGAEPVGLGSPTRRVARALKWGILGWSWSDRDGSPLRLENGSVLLLHSDRPSCPAEVGALVAELRRRHLTPVTVEEMLRHLTHPANPAA